MLHFAPAVVTEPAPEPTTESITAEVVREATSAVAVLLAVAAALVLALLLAEVISAVVRAVGQRTRFRDALSRRARLPLRAVLAVVAVWIAIRIVADGDPGWLSATEHALLIALIVTVTWLIGSLAFVAEGAALTRFRTDVPDNRHARRVRTQVMLLRRATVAVLAVCGAAAVLLTFPGARTWGAGLLASAGLLSVVVGLAAQSSLSNAFAGLQLAFTDAIRVDDVVVVEGEWGRIEEITLTYVVVHVWDDRRLILPSTWFTTTPFQNWTRRAADLLGTVELDLDWDVPVDGMRLELTRLLQHSELWDHRVGILQVTEATGGYVRVRALASAEDAPTLFDLRCHVREGLVQWLQREHPEALPRTRWEDSTRTPLRRGGDSGRLGGADSGPARPASAEPALPELPDPDQAEAGRPEPDRSAPEGPSPSDRPEQGGSPSAPAQEEDGATRPMPVTGAEPPVRRRVLAVQQDTVRLDVDRHSRLFTGSLAAVERSKAFSGPGQEVIDEREQAAERQPDAPDDVPEH